MLMIMLTSFSGYLTQKKGSRSLGNRSDVRKYLRCCNSIKSVGMRLTPSNRHSHQAAKIWAPDGKRSPRKSKLITTWGMTRSSNSGRCWEVTKMCSPGTRANWVAAPLVSITLTRKDSCLAKPPLVDYPTGRKLKSKDKSMHW